MEVWKLVLSIISLEKSKSKSSQTCVSPITSNSHQPATDKTQPVQLNPSQKKRKRNCSKTPLSLFVLEYRGHPSGRGCWTPRKSSSEGYRFQGTLCGRGHVVKREGAEVNRLSMGILWTVGRSRPVGGRSRGVRILGDRCVTGARRCRRRVCLRRTAVPCPLWSCPFERPRLVSFAQLASNRFLSVSTYRELERIEHLIILLFTCSRFASFDGDGDGDEGERRWTGSLLFR